MPIPHFFLALSVAIIWGINFIFVKFCLNEMSPLMLCTLRFFLASIPAIFFIKPPAMPVKTVILYGVIMFALQFTFLFWGLHAGMTPGVASLIMQVQVFFSLFLAAIFLGERPNIMQITGALISFMGIGLIAKHFDSTITLTGSLCVLAAAATWAIGNLITKQTQKVNMLSLVIWGSFFASIPMIILTLLIDGPEQIAERYTQISSLGLLSLFYIAYISTLVGYGLWNWLLSRYPLSTIVPFSLLVPIIGLLSSIILLGEPFQTWKLTAALLLISGLCINLLSPRILTKKIEATPLSDIS